MIRWFEQRQVYAPLRAVETCALDWPIEEVQFTARDQCQLHGWFFPAEKGSGRSHLVFLLMHGNAGNVGTRLGFYEAWLGLGVNLFSFDYRGYGRSQGVPSEEGTYQDAEAAHAWLVARGFAPENIVALGKSLGGGVASELALRRPLGGLILQSTFTSIADVGADIFPFLPVRWMNTIKYDTLGKLPRIHIPVLIIHSRGDETVRFRHAERNYAAANQPKMFWEITSGHTDILQTGRAHYLAGLEKYLRAHFKQSPSN
jgi:pimeloyl-ACP methyl ester carboxylesterase